MMVMSHFLSVFIYLFTIHLSQAQPIDTTAECPAEWRYLNGHCVLVKLMKVTFETAIQECARYNGILAPIRTKDEVLALFSTHGNRYKNLYIGTWVATNNSGDSYVNLDGTQSEWFNIYRDYNQEIMRDVIVRGQSPMVIRGWGPCLVTSSTNYTVDQYSVPCNTIADGFLCQVWSVSKLNGDIVQLSLNQNTMLYQMATLRAQIDKMRSELNSSESLANRTGSLIDAVKSQLAKSMASGQTNTNNSYIRGQLASMSAQEKGIKSELADIDTQIIKIEAMLNKLANTMNLSYLLKRQPILVIICLFIIFTLLSFALFISLYMIISSCCKF